MFNDRHNNQMHMDFNECNKNVDNDIKWVGGHSSVNFIEEKDEMDQMSQLGKNKESDQASQASKTDQIDQADSGENKFSDWYNKLVIDSQLAEHSSVRGSMIIKPYGYALWDNMKNILDKMFKDTGHQNAYFPLLIPKELFELEENNASGFAKECAVVTHYRLIADNTHNSTSTTDSKQGTKLIVDPDAKLLEPLIIRPTSEAIIWSTYKNWIKSYRDLPILINQWANVFRWEMRTRLFLRTSEFLWQEGHTAHATKEEAIDEATKMLDVYTDFVENYMAIPVIKGVKTANERFAGAVDTYCIEAIMQDGKALQMGTSHFLGQNFAKAFNVTFTSKENKQELVWATSWGSSTRLIGAMIMTHGDQKGLVMPPRIAPICISIIPVYRKNANSDNLAIDAYVQEMINGLKQHGIINIQYDNDQLKSTGYKFAECEMRGIPIRITIGIRDVNEATLELVRRDSNQKNIFSLQEVKDNNYKLIHQLLKDIHNNMLLKASIKLYENIVFVDTWDEFTDAIAQNLGFVAAHWDQSSATEEKIKELTKATIRCIPLNNSIALSYDLSNNQIPLEILDIKNKINHKIQKMQDHGTCILTGAISQKRVLFARNY